MLLLVLDISNGQTPAPTTNTTIPDVATLRPTVSPTTGPPTDMPTIDPASLPRTSGEPARVVTVSVSLTVMVISTIIGICLVARQKNTYCNKLGSNVNRNSVNDNNANVNLW